MNLRSGSLDFSLNKNGEYYFLEVNPNGQWLWLEHKTGVSISKEIANSLMGIF
jgi:D-alanine-D-alanine ligase-like ATP-grasp enzyme